MFLQNCVQLCPVTLLYITRHCINPKQGSPVHSISQMLEHYFCVIFYTACVLIGITVEIQHEIICFVYILHHLPLLKQWMKLRPFSRWHSFEHKAAATCVTSELHITHINSHKPSPIICLYRLTVNIHWALSIYIYTHTYIISQIHAFYTHTHIPYIYSGMGGHGLDWYGSG
jgi:hypothetical protein